MTPVKFERSRKPGHKAGDFSIEILYPGALMNDGDSGIGTIARIDHAHIHPGTVVGMHPHQNDEILTYLRSGTVFHTDSVGNKEGISSTRLMLMNAGHYFEHEEEILGGEDLQGLQIFIRPEKADLAPMVQFHDFGEAISRNEWRLLAGPASEAPLMFRSATWIHDSRLNAGKSLPLPIAPVKGAARILYVFKGGAEIMNLHLTEGDSLILGDDAGKILAHTDTDLVLFTTDPETPVFKGGMFSGNIM